MDAPDAPPVVVDGGWSTSAEADHAAAVLAGALAGTSGTGTRVATHVLADDAGRRTCLALDVVASALAEHLPLVPGAVVVDAPEVVRAHRGRTSGRLVVFRGSDALVGRRTAAEVVGTSEVDAVVGLAGTVVEPGTVVDLGDFVRPTWRAGRCELLVQGGPGGVRPFEVREQIPCCADH